MKLNLYFNEESIEKDVLQHPIKCVASSKNKTVDLCLKNAYKNMHIPVARIKLYDKDRFILASKTFDSAEKLGKEIERRWCSAEDLEQQNQRLLEVMDFVLSPKCEDKLNFLRLWYEGDFEPIKEEWPEFQGYIGDE